MNIGSTRIDDKTRAASNSIVLGSPGFGKSKFLEYLMRQDLAGRQPFCLIDLHGTLYERIKTWCAFNVYNDRRILLLDPSQGAYVKPWNPFARIEGVEIGVQTSSMVEATLSIWGDSNPNSYPVMFKILKIFFTVVAEKGISISEAFHLLGDRKDLSSVVETLSDSYIKTVWNDLKQLPHFEWSRQVTPTMNRLFRIVQSKSVQRFMSVRTTAPQFEYTFEDTVVVNLGPSSSLDSDAAKMFAVLLLNGFYQQAMRREGDDGKDPKPYYIYVDEWLIPTPDFSRILAQTRKFGLLLVLANQDLSQINSAFGSGFGQTILTLCQMQFCFGGLNESDASRLAREWNIDSALIRNLGERQYYAKLPRQDARLIEMPDVRDPFLGAERVAEFERRIAADTGALRIEDVEKLLPTPHNEEEPGNGYAAQPKQRR